ncbi:MAG: DUF1587 domain-containing protein, partial [Pirellulales bacterium]|nr:DUF1587 domain-containing protein [Pirellulales bacterium]
MFCTVGVSWADDAAIAPDVDGFRSTIAKFVSAHCADCHGADEQEGDVRLDDIDGDLVRGKSVSLWRDVLHRMETGEMPPKDADQPTSAERTAVTKWIRHELRKHLTARYGVPGRVVVRRLSRNEYRNTMRDLLGLDYDIGRELPPDTTYHGFDHVAEVQELSRSQMETYLNLARYSIDRALVTGQRPITFHYRSEPEKGKDGLEWRVVTHGVQENIDNFDAPVKKLTRDARAIPKKPDEWSKTHRFDIRGANENKSAKNGVWLQAPRNAYKSKGGDWGKLGF